MGDDAQPRWAPILQTRQSAVLGSLPIPDGWVSLDAIIRGQPLRFVSVHLRPGPDTGIQQKQAEELVAVAGGDTTLPLIFGGTSTPPTSLRIHTMWSIKHSSTED